MMDLNGIWESNKKMKIVTGLTLSEAEFLIQDFEAELKKIRRKNPASKVGRPAKFEGNEIFLMLMLFIRHYLTYELIAVMFNVDVSTVKRWIDDSYLALGELLVKKNFRHLLALNQEKLSEVGLEDYQKSMLMELSNL